MKIYYLNLKERVQANLLNCNRVIFHIFVSIMKDPQLYLKMIEYVTLPDKEEDN